VGVLLAGVLTPEERKTITPESVGIVVNNDVMSMDGLAQERQKRLIAKMEELGVEARQVVEKILGGLGDHKPYLKRLRQVIAGSKKPTATMCREFEAAFKLPRDSVVVKMTKKEASVEKSKASASQAPVPGAPQGAPPELPVSNSNQLSRTLVLGKVDFGKVQVQLKPCGQEVQVVLTPLPLTAAQLLQLLRE
jgi:hypothetical protein